jgi:beta-glucosidase
VGSTLFPHNIGLGAANDPDLIRRIGQVTALEVRVTGQDWTFAPTLAVVRDDRWGRTYESYSENSALVASYAGAMIEGLQGVYGTPEWLGDAHVIATAKHFIGDGGTVRGVDQGDNRDSEADLAAIQGAGYPPAIESGVLSVMASFNSWHGEKVHGHRGLLTDILVQRLGFEGFVVGDWNGHGQVEGCTAVSCAQSFNAGVDMFMAPDSWRELHASLLGQVRSGEVAMERLDEAVARILRVKVRAGLLDAPRPSQRPYAGEFERLGSPEHRAVAREAVRRSMVLLKNEGSVLPIAGSSRVLSWAPRPTVSVSSRAAGH